MPTTDLNPFQYLAPFYRFLAQPGALLVTQGPDDQPNVMTVGWAHVGILWRRPVCIVYVRPSRHSYTCLEHLRQFTLNTATTDLAKAVALCGSRSGRDLDKFHAASLTPAPSRTVKPPIIEECLLHYECTVAHYHDLAPSNLRHDIHPQFYPTADFHRVYYGEITATHGRPDQLDQYLSDPQA